MKGLVLKDMYIIKGTILTTATIIAILMLYCVIRDFSIGFVIIPPIIFAATTTSTFKLDWAIKWDKKALTMPVTRKEIVFSKYFELIFLCLTGTLVGFTIENIYNFFKKSVSFVMVANLAVVSLSFAIICGSFHIMLIYKFGGDYLENSELLLFGASGISIAILALCLYIFRFFVTIQLDGISFVPVVLFLISLFVYFVTYRMSVVLYSAKEL